MMSEEHPSEIPRIRATVVGRVQGVGFRAFVQREATGLGVVGYVRNRWDGAVEVVGDGQRKSLERLLARIRQGPPASDVARIDVEWLRGGGEFRSFHVRF
jgi:acylphosphatase